MDPKTLAFRVPIIDAAIGQLDWAIRLFIDNKAYVPAITLAGAAEELLGKMVDNNSRKRIIESLTNKGHQEREIGMLMNRARNALKHGSEATQNPDGQSIEMELETEAIQLITRGITNLIYLDNSITSQTQRFWTWIPINRPDLLTP